MADEDGESREAKLAAKKAKLAAMRAKRVSSPDVVRVASDVFFFALCRSRLSFALSSSHRAVPTLLSVPHHDGCRRPPLIRPVPSMRLWLFACAIIMFFWCLVPKRESRLVHVIVNCVGKCCGWSNGLRPQTNNSLSLSLDAFQNSSSLASLSPTVCRFHQRKQCRADTVCTLGGGGRWQGHTRACFCERVGGERESAISPCTRRIPSCPHIGFTPPPPLFVDSTRTHTNITYSLSCVLSDRSLIPQHTTSHSHHSCPLFRVLRIVFSVSFEPGKDGCSYPCCCCCCCCHRSSHTRGGATIAASNRIGRWCRNKGH